MAGIDDLLAAFMGQTNTALNAPAAPWQQELLESVNPEKVKRQNIARALAQASTAMATTPGNFLQGVSAAAATGANSYLTGKDEAEAQRLKVQQLLGMQQQQDQDRRMRLLMDAVGVQRNQIQDQRQAKLDSERVPDREKWDYEVEQDRLGLTKENQALQAATKKARSRAASEYRKWIQDYRKEKGVDPSPDERSAEWSDILDKYDVGQDATDGSAPALQPGQAQVLDPSQYENAGAAQPPASAAPEATKTINGKTYVKINGKWFEQQ